MITLKFKDKNYEVLSVHLSVHIKVWYFYDKNWFVNIDNELCYGFLCFTLVYTLKEIKNNGSSIGFSKR